MRFSERNYVGALGKGLAVIQALGASGRGRTLSEVASSTQLTRAARPRSRWR